MERIPNPIAPAMYRSPRPECEVEAITRPPSRRLAKAVQIMNVMFRPAVLPRSLGPCRACRGGSTDSSPRARPFGRREEHEGREILQDIVEPVLGPRWNEHNAPGTHLAILSPHSNSCAAADDVVDLILGMGQLLVLAAPREFVQATTHRRDPP